MRRLLLPALLAAALLLSGCGSFFDAEYVVETTYEPVLSVSSAERGDTTVHSLDELKEVLEKIQKLTDEYIKKLDVVCADKEKEIMTV